MDFDEASLKKYGFEGFIQIGALKRQLCKKMPLVALPKHKGVYVVFKRARNRPRFLDEGTGGWFPRKKPKNPNVPVNILEEKWIDGAQVIYIGQTKTLRHRIKTRLLFGMKKPVGAWGGRYIWQFKDANKLLIAWKETSDGKPCEVERKLIDYFKRIYGRLPFANLR